MSIHKQAIKQLPTADYLIIEEEHVFLQRFLDDLHQACTCYYTDCKNCSREEKSSCQGRLTSFLFYIIELASKHFSHEETIMLSRPGITAEYTYFRMHRQAHTEIMQKLYALVDECFLLNKGDNTTAIYRHFYEELISLFGEHDRAFDDPFIQSTKA